MVHRLLVRLLAPSILLATSCAAPADVVATYRSTVGRRVIEVSDSGWGRIDEWPRGASAPLDDYDLTTPDGRNLRIFRHKGRRIVADSRDYDSWRRRSWQPTAPGAPPRSRFVADGEQKVGGWTGTAYRAVGDICGSWSHFVVMRGPEFERFGRVVRRNLLYGAKDRPSPDCELQAIDLIGTGILLWVDDPEITLEALEVRRIDPRRFRLPARPLSRAALFALLGADQPTNPVIVPPRAPQQRR